MISPTGPRRPTSASDSGGGGGVWTTPQNVYAADTLYASGNITGAGQVTNWLYSAGYGFNLPSTAVIEGIYVEFLRYGGLAATGQVSTMKGFALSGTPKSGTDNWPGTPAYVGYGGPTDLWGQTWTPTDINNSGFGFALQAYNTHGGGGTALVDVMQITVYWHTAPTDVPKRYIYKVFNAGAKYLGNLPNVKSSFSVSQDINTCGSQIYVECGVSADTSRLPSDPLTDEAGNPLTDEAGNTLTNEGATPIVAPGSFTNDALIKNGNTIQVFEYGYYNPNGKCMFRGQIERWEADFGDTGDIVRLLAYSDGQDLDNYIVRGYPYTYTADQTNVSQNTGAVLSQSGATWNRYGQSWKAGLGVNNVAAIAILLSGVANVTVSVYDNPSLTNLLGSVTQYVALTSPTENQFNFPIAIPIVAGTTYFFAVQVNDGESIAIYYQNSDIYANGIGYNSNYGGSGGGNYMSLGGDLYFRTFTGTGSTSATFTSMDPTTGMVAAFMTDYRARGGAITYNSSSIDSTGLSLTYNLITNTVYEGIRAALTLAPAGFYYYVDLGTDVFYLKASNTVADLVITKGRHIEKLKFVATIENIKNQVFFTGGPVSGVNLYHQYQDPTSVSLYGPKLDRQADNRVITDGTANAIGLSAVAEHKNENYQTTVTIIDKTMDTTLLHVGLVIGFNGFGTFIDNLLAQVVRVDYSPEEVTLTLGLLPKRLHPEFERITRGLIAQQTLLNPSTPS